MRAALAAACLAAGVSAPAGPAVRSAKVVPWVQDEIRRLGEADVIVVLAGRADLAAAASGAEDRLARRRAVFTALRDEADRRQASLRAYLSERNIPFRSFQVVNALALRADAALLDALAARPDVERIAGNPRLKLPAPEPAGDPAPPGLSCPGDALAAAPEWGVERIRAPVLWALGFDGQGIVIGGQDTGVRWTHEAVRDRYRGWDGVFASHDYNWHDSVHANGAPNPCGADLPEPCDDHGHGTHTIGTAAGGGAAAAIGVAPGARWIACRNMDGGYGTPATYLECFDFFLAPYPVGGTPSQGDPALGPDVTVNSWGCPPAEGCDWDTLTVAVEAQRAAGIFTAVSAGNSGPGCGSVSSPPGNDPAAFSVGASNASDRLARFSSRGPGIGTGAMKPDVVAPGVGVRSATAEADDSYAAWNGTSMAAPHVAGAVALLWQAAPILRGDIPRTEELLRRTARPLRDDVESCGGDNAFGPNNSWGEGLIDLELALAAVSLPTNEGACNDGRDGDGDGFTDCADDECAGAPNCPEIGNCLDWVDNDQDGRTDCADVECAGDPLCPELGNCSDGVDNDLDGDVDCADRSCDVDPDCPGLAMSEPLLLGPGGLTPPLSQVFDAACRFPSWALCPAAVHPGPMPGRVADELLPAAAPSLRLYQHSDGDLGCARAGSDLVFAVP